MIVFYVLPFPTEFPLKQPATLETGHYCSGARAGRADNHKPALFNMSMASSLTTIISCSYTFYICIVLHINVHVLLLTVLNSCYSSLLP